MAAVTDQTVLREALLRALSQGPATWPELQVRARCDMDIIAAGLALSTLEQEGLIKRARLQGATWSTYELVSPR